MQANLGNNQNRLRPNVWIQTFDLLLWHSRRLFPASPITQVLTNTRQRQAGGLRIPSRGQLFPTGGAPHVVPTGADPREVVTNKWGIDATRPPTSRPEARARFERTVPPFHDDVRLEDYLGM